MIKKERKKERKKDKRNVRKETEKEREIDSKNRSERERECSDKQVHFCATDNAYQCTLGGGGVSMSSFQFLIRCKSYCCHHSTVSVSFNEKKIKLGIKVTFNWNPNNCLFELNSTKCY